MRWLRHAFAVEPAGPPQLSADETRVVDRLARGVVRRGLTTPTLMALECSHPLNFVASQAMVFVGPIAKLIFDQKNYDTLARVLEKRGSVEVLAQRIEAVAAEPVQDDADTDDAQPDVDAPDRSEN